MVIPALNRGHLRKIPYDFCLAGLIFSLPLITIGAANAFGWMLAYLRGAIVIADWITSIAGNDPHLIMLLMVLLFTVVGDFIEPVPTIIIFMPLVNALTQAGDINGVHMGVVLIATLAFGLITPPYGLVLLMASKFVGVSFGKALRAALPIYVVFLVTICFTIYFPKVVLWLPKHVIPESVGCFKSPAGTGYICPPLIDFASAIAESHFPCSVKLLHRGAEFVGVHAVDDGVALGVELLLDRRDVARGGSAPWWRRARPARFAPAEAPVRGSRLSVRPPARP